MDGRVAAVSQETGEFVWTTQIGYDPPKKGQAVSGAPLYVDGRIYVGLANGDWAFRGKVVALDASDGRLLWEFYTIPRPRRAGTRDVAAGGRVGPRLGAGRRRRVARRERRPGAWARLFRHRQRRAHVRRRGAPRRQPVYGGHSGARHGHRRPALALPGGAPRPVGRRHRHRAAAVRGGGKRRAAAGTRGAARPTASCSCSTARPASRCTRSRSGRCRRTRTTSPRPRSRFR